MNRIREIHKSKGFTLEQLASKMEPEITLASVQKLETGKMALTLDYIVDIARVLGVAPQDIIAETAGAVVVPVISGNDLAKFADAVTKSREFSPVPHDAGGDNIFAVRPRPGLFDRICAPGGLLVIDPDQFELEEGRVFVLRTDDGACRVYRFLTGPTRFEPCSSEDGDESIALGRIPFTVAGRVTYALSPI